MGIFDKVLASEETIFKNGITLSYDYIPKLIPFRESQQFRIANCIKPLFSKMNGKNIIISGLPGIGKTLATKKVLNELEEETDDIIPIYINCWQKGTSYKVYLDICDQLDFKFTQNKRTEDLLEVIKKIINKKSAVFVFDEIDKVEDPNFIYSLLEEILYKSVICITNDKYWINSLDKRIYSRLHPESLEFQPYTLSETKQIIQQRSDIAYYPEVVEAQAIDLISKKTYDKKDIRTGLYILKESGLISEDKSMKKITTKEVEEAIAKMPDFKIKEIDQLENEDQTILNLIKENSPSKIGDLFRKFQEKGGKSSYKTFQRKIGKLQENKFISAKKQTGGPEGTTTVISYDASNRQLTDF